MKTTKRLSKLLILILVHIGMISFATATWWYGDIIQHEATDEGCTIQEEVLPEVEEWCTDPFFQDMEKQAHILEDDFIALPSIDVPQIGMEEEIEVEAPPAEKIVQKVVQQEPVKAKAKLMPKKVDVVVAADEQEVVEEKAEPMVDTKKPESYKPLVLKFSEDTPTEADTWTEHASAVNLAAPQQTLTIASVFDKHLWEIVFIAFLIFLLFSLLFI